MKLFFGSITVGANNLEAAARWYAEKFDLENYGVIEENGARFCELTPGGNAMEPEIVLCQKESGEAEPDRPILNTANAAKAREWLLARQVNVGPVETDRQGTHYFEMRDSEGNTVEICEEP